MREAQKILFNDSIGNNEKREILINEIKQVFDADENEDCLMIEGYDASCKSTIHILINNIPFFMVKSMRFKIKKSFIEVWHHGKMISYFPIKDITRFEI